MNEDIVFFIGHINYVGGVEQWFYYIQEMYGKDRNITLVYKWAAPKQLERLIDKTKCVMYDGQDIECNTFIFCYDMSIIDKVRAKEYILTIHADYKYQKINITIPRQTTKIFCVSELARKSFIETHGEQAKKLGLEIGLLYNPIITDNTREQQRVLRLISATRLTKEKGGKRIEQMAMRLNELKIPFIWAVFTNERLESSIDGLVYMKQNLNILPFIKDADYLVQLSDTEGFAYSIVESLVLGTPIIITEIPVAKEMGAEYGKNAFILKFDMSNLDEVINDAYKNNIKGFEYKHKESSKIWNELLGKPMTNKYIKTNKIWVMATRGFNDVVLKRYIEINEKFETTKARAKYLLDKGAVVLTNGGDK